MSFWTYMLRCADESFYVGHTDSLETRIGQHWTGSCGGYTASRHPLLLVWTQEFATRDEALRAERQIKGWSRRKKQVLIRGDWQEISRLARSRSRAASDPKAVRGEPVEARKESRVTHSSVRPEPVEGRAEECAESVHGSTGSPRTDLGAGA